MYQDVVLRDCGTVVPHTLAAAVPYIFAAGGSCQPSPGSGLRAKTDAKMWTAGGGIMVTISW